MSWRFLLRPLSVAITQKPPVKICNNFKPPVKICNNFKTENSYIDIICITIEILSF